MHSLTMSDYGMPTTDTDFACMDVGEAYPYAPEWFDTEISDVKLAATATRHRKRLWRSTART